jgi:cupin fold WbuC family metalloprotein
MGTQLSHGELKMPEIIYSKVEKEKQLLVINRKLEISEDRTDICSENQLLQISTKLLKKGTSFRPHKHNQLERVTNTTHEAWIILQGSVEAKFWDIDDKLIYETILDAGDCAVVYSAGHGFEVLEEGTILYEVKNGPYYGQLKDKTFIKGV